MKKVSFSLLVLVLIGIGGYAIYSYTRKVKSAGKYKPAVTLPIDSLTHLFSKNPQAFESTYKEMVIRITGNIEKIEKQSETVLTIQFPESNGYVVHCELQEAGVTLKGINTICLDCFYVGYEEGMPEMGVPSILRFNRCNFCNK